MNKKLLLRRPRLTVNNASNNENLILDSACQITSFKDDIQPEIEALDKELLNYIKENASKNRQLTKDDIYNTSTPEFANECSLVSIYDINKGFGLVEPDILIKSRENFNKLKISNKTSNQYEKIKSSSTNGKVVFNQNLFKQTQQDLPATNKSIPKHIIIIQLAALLRQQVSNNINKNVSCSIKSLSSYEKSLLNRSEAPKYEIILYGNDDIQDLQTISSNKLSDILQSDFLTADMGNSRQIFNEEITEQISPTRISLMECLMTGRHTLNLAAHSISQLPNIADIFKNISFLDLSYNDFKIIPDEIYQLQNLQELNLKNNPLQILDDSISSLISLRILDCSFTLISNVPSSLFRCKYLQHVDLSYNNIAFIPHVDGLCRLKDLNLSGNPIRYFKKSFTKLNLENLGLENTWTHPLFWEKEDFVLTEFENSWAFCDTCDQLLSDFSTNFIAFSRRFEHILPILMSFCSDLCRNAFFKMKQ